MVRYYLILMVLFCGISYGQSNYNSIRFNDQEYFEVVFGINPVSSLDWKGVIDGLGSHVNLEVGFVGAIYAKVGVEAFPQLEGGYYDIHGGVGINLVKGMDNPFRYYAGVRAARVTRADGFEVNPGLEAGVDFNFSDNWFVGVRGIYDKRYDQRLLGWEVENQAGVFIRIGYKIHL